MPRCSRALTLTAHEWLHTYWFFRPLGWNFWSGSQMTTLNETAADLAGKELGNLGYQAITGQKVEELAISDPPLSGEAQAPEGVDLGISGPSILIARCGKRG